MTASVELQLQNTWEILPRNKIECEHCGAEEIAMAIMIADTSYVDTTGEPIPQFICKHCFLDWINDDNPNWIKGYEIGKGT